MAEVQGVCCSLCVWLRTESSRKKARGQMSKWGEAAYCGKGTTGQVHQKAVCDAGSCNKAVEGHRPEVTLTTAGSQAWLCVCACVRTRVQAWRREEASRDLGYSLVGLDF